MNNYFRFKTENDTSDEQLILYPFQEFIQSVVSQKE